jgi:hypothetical protein
MDKMVRLSRLGLQRLRVLDCLGGNNSGALGYFEPAADADIFAAYDAYVARMSEQFAADPYPLTISLLAAGRLLTGDLAAAGVILDYLPAEAVKLDHGAGICLVTPVPVVNLVRLAIGGRVGEAAVRCGTFAD